MSDAATSPAADLVALRRRIDSVVRRVERPLRLEGKLVPAADLEDALRSVYARCAGHPLPSHLIRENDDRSGYVDGGVTGLFRREYQLSVQIRQLRLLLADETLIYLYASYGENNYQHFDGSIAGVDRSAVAAAARATVEELASRGARVTMHESSLQSLRERIFTLAARPADRTLSFAAPSSLDCRELMVRLMSLYRRIVGRPLEIAALTDGVGSGGSSTADEAHCDTDVGALLVLADWYGGTPGDALKTELHLVLPDDTLIGTYFIDSCTMVSIDFTLRAATTATLDAIAAALTREMSRPLR